MSRRQMARLALRAATEDDHASVDRVFSHFVLSERDGYRRFLQAQAEAFVPLEAAVAATEPFDILPDWDRRRRSHLIAADLAALGITLDPPSIDRRLAGAPDVLGTVYVLEGSRLGGAMLARSVPDDFPRSFLEGGDSGLWRLLIEILDARLSSDDDRGAAIRAAQAAFAAFERSARRHVDSVDLV